MYKYKRIKQETHERFIHELEETFERIAPGYNSEFYTYVEPGPWTSQGSKMEYKKVITNFCDEFRDNFL